MFYSITGALQATGLDKMTILRAIEDGKIAAAKDLFGEWQIERSALHRAFPPAAAACSGSDAEQPRAEPHAATFEAEIGALFREAGAGLRRGPDDGLLTTQATRGSGRELASLPPIDQIGTTVPTASAWFHQIGTGSRDSGQRLRVMLATGILLAVLSLGWVAGWSSYRFFLPAPHKQLTSSARNLLENETTCTSPATGRAATPSTPTTRNVVTPKIPRRGRGHELSHGTAQPNADPNNPASPVALQNAASSRITEAVPPQAKFSPRPGPTPTPDTRPTTIPGWTVREVVGSTAVLEGADGIVKVARGDTVPGLGRIDLIVRWGSRWIVATSRGLITTQ